ncbi:MAG: Fpg/Nei family DNA glycosylase [Deltaproteobacteria bacterium]|nr:Fpg/Nei family DNA glycosylase [Deltaproteobacteria bacterium]
MPELPDVEVYKQYIDATSLHQKISSVSVRDSRIARNFNGSQMDEWLKGKTLEKTARHGKHLFILAGDDVWMMWHFGMTGAVRYLKKERKNADYERVTFYFDNKYRLSYDARRMLGGIQRIEGPEDFIREKGLGIDALDPALDLDRARELLAGKRAMAKSTLMKQETIAGIGNIYSDEILFQARIHPETSMDHLDAKEFSTLFKTMKAVLKKAVDIRAEPSDMPATWITPRRQPGKPCPRGCGSRIQKKKVSGRSAYFCPACQEKK